VRGFRTRKRTKAVSSGCRSKGFPSVEFSSVRAKQRKKIRKKERKEGRKKEKIIKL
jgi:hypothetical protein